MVVHERHRVTIALLVATIGGDSCHVVIEGYWCGASCSWWSTSQVVVVVRVGMVLGALIEC